MTFSEWSLDKAEAIVSIIVTIVTAIGGGILKWRGKAIRDWYIARRDARRLMLAMPYQLEEIHQALTKLSLQMYMFQKESHIHLQFTDLAVWHSSMDGQATLITPALDRLLGISVEQAAGWGWLAAVHIDDRDDVQNDFREACRDARIYRGYMRYVHEDGSVHYVHSYAEPVISEGKVISYVGIAREITREEWRRLRHAGKGDIEE